MEKGFEYVFQNYVYVPVISAIIGAIFSVFVPKLFFYVQAKIKVKVNRSIDTIDISGKWTSLFHEGNDIQSEIVELNQNGQFVDGEIYLDNRKYILNGEFKNQILIANYLSKNKIKEKMSVEQLFYEE